MCSNTQYYLFPVLDSAPFIVVSTPQGWRQCNTHDDGVTVRFDPTNLRGNAFYPDVEAYPIPADMVTRGRFEGWLTLNRFFYETDWTSEDSEDEGDWEDYEPPEYDNDPLNAAPLYEHVPPPSYDVALLSPPAYY